MRTKKNVAFSVSLRMDPTASTKTALFDPLADGTAGRAAPRARNAYPVHLGRRRVDPSTETADIRAEPVLIVDDSPVVRSTLRDMLQALGFKQIVEAKDSGDGMAAYEAHRPTLILLDITMPDAPGTRLAKQILRTDGSARVVVVTAVSRDEDLVESVIGFGAYDYIRKPVRLADLQGLVARIEAERAVLERRDPDA